MRFFNMTLGAILLSAAPGLANPPLQDQSEIQEGMIIAGMAIEIADNCDDLNVRLVRGMNHLRALEDRARELGYSDEEIDSYIENDAEKDRLESLARTRLVDLGVVPGSDASYCRVGEAQVASNTAVGRLLR
jgi:hypothetical protein